MTQMPEYKTLLYVEMQHQLKRLLLSATGESD